MPVSRAAERMKIPLTLKDNQIEVYDGRPGASTPDSYATMLKDCDISPVEEEDPCGELCPALCEKMAGEFNVSDNDQGQKKVVLSFEKMASKKAQAKETGVEAMSPETSISSTRADLTSSALGEPKSSSDSTLPEVLPIERLRYEVTVAVHNSGRDKRRIKCYLCKQTGHISGNCRNCR